MLGTSLPTASQPSAPTSSAMAEQPTVTTTSSLLEYQEQEVLSLENQKSHKRVILLALDISEGSKHAFYWAKEHLFRPEDSLILVHVRATQLMVADFHGDIMMALHQMDQAAKQESHRLLQAYAKELQGCKVTAYAIRGEPRTEILRKAKELNADLVVVGSRGMGMIKRAVLGSLSDYIVHHATCPVLVVRPSSHKDA